MAICEMNHSTKMKYHLGWLLFFLLGFFYRLWSKTCILNILQKTPKWDNSESCSYSYRQIQGEVQDSKSVRRWLFLATQIFLIPSFKISIIPCALDLWYIYFLRVNYNKWINIRRRKNIRYSLKCLKSAVMCSIVKAGHGSQ